MEFLADSLRQSVQSALVEILPNEVFDLFLDSGAEVEFIASDDFYAGDDIAGVDIDHGGDLGGGDGVGAGQKRAHQQQFHSALQGNPKSTSK